jgi:hypothetical protein
MITLAVLPQVIPESRASPTQLMIFSKLPATLKTGTTLSESIMAGTPQTKVMLITEAGDCTPTETLSLGPMIDGQV